MGDTYDNGLQDASIAKHLGAKSRWILQGFHDPDIAILNRSVPTPETMDVPLALQMLASVKARAWVGDVQGAFTQGLRNLHRKSHRLQTGLELGSGFSFIACSS